MNRDAIAREWLAELVAGYPGESSRYLERERDPFRNPVGRAYREGVRSIVDAVLDGGEPAQAHAAIEELVRIRAVQAVVPADGAGFVRSLKATVRRHPDPGASREAQDALLAAIDRRIDALALFAADIDHRCRTQLDEMRTRASRLSVHAFRRTAVP